MKYIYRPNDFSIFVELDNGEYTLEANLESHTQHNSYTYDELVNAFGFIPCTEDELPELKIKHDSHHAYTLWASRPDGHGGAKGGTKEEYLKTLR